MGRHSSPDDPDDSPDTGGGQPGPEYPGGYYETPRNDAPPRETTGNSGYAEDASDYEIGYGATDRDHGADYWQADSDDDDDAEYDPRYDAPEYGVGVDPPIDAGADYLDDPEPATYAFASSTPPPNRPPASGPQHGGDWDGGEWTGSHRAIKAGRRGISVGVIVALVTVVVVVGAVISWRFFGDALSSRSEAGAARCVAGEVAVSVIADPSIADQLGPLAEKYNQSADPVGDRCVKVAVKAADSDQVVDGFVGTWPEELGERPALWIPGS